MTKSRKQSTSGQLVSLFRFNSRKEQEEKNAREAVKATQAAATAAAEQKELESTEPSKSADPGVIDYQFRSKMAEVSYSWEVVKNLSTTKELLNNIAESDSKMTLRQLYQLTNNIRDALQDSNQIGVVVEAIQHFNKQLNAHKENPNAQKNDIVKFIARTQALAAHVNQNNIADNVIKSKSLRDQFEKKLTANLNLMPKIELYKKSEGKGLVGKPIVSILKGSLLMTLSQLQHDPDITASPNEKKKTKKALKALENRLTETSNLLQDICPRLKELHATFPKDQAAIEKIHTAVVDLLLTTPRKHQDAFDSRKIHETLNNAILEAGKSEISPKLREALTEMKAKYDTQFQSKPQKPKAAAEVSAAPEEAAPTTPAMRR